MVESNYFLFLLFGYNYAVFWLKCYGFSFTFTFHYALKTKLCKKQSSDVVILVSRPRNIVYRPIFLALCHDIE